MPSQPLVRRRFNTRFALRVALATAVAMCLLLPREMFAKEMSAAQHADAVQLLDMTNQLVVNDRRLPYRLLAPTTGDRMPVVLFSHGAYSSNAHYDAILKPWAAAGFVVIAPIHRDSVELGTARGTQNPQFFAWRMADMQVLLNGLPEVLARAGITTRADSDRIVVTGHSFGGLVAQTLAGAQAQGISDGATDSRFRGVIIVSGAGLIPGLVDKGNLASLTLPLLVTVGTEDLAQAPGLSGYEWRRQIFDYAGSASRLLLIQEGADHYLGGQIGRDDLALAPHAADYLHDFLTLSVTVLKSWVASDPSARNELGAHISSPETIRRGQVELPRRHF